MPHVVSITPLREKGAKKGRIVEFQFKEGDSHILYSANDLKLLGEGSVVRGRDLVRRHFESIGIVSMPGQTRPLQDEIERLRVRKSLEGSVNCANCVDCEYSSKV